MEFVSIIIPTFNRAYCIKVAIQSVLNQTYTNFELIIVDDGSTDNTEEIIHGIKDNRIRYVKMPRNDGPSAARNYGVKCAKFEIIAFHDSDDEWVSNKLERQMDILKQKENVAMVYTQMNCINKISGKEILIPNNSLIPMECREGRIFPYLLVFNYIGAPTMVVRKTCFEQIGGFDEDLLCLEDWDFVLRLSRFYDIGYIDEPLYISYRGDSCSVDSSIDNHIKARCVMVKKFKEDYKNYGMLDNVVNELISKGKLIGIEREIETTLLEYIEG